MLVAQRHIMLSAQALPGQSFRAARCLTTRGTRHDSMSDRRHPENSLAPGIPGELWAQPWGSDRGGWRRKRTPAGSGFCVGPGSGRTAQIAKENTTKRDFYLAMV
jgi:hypothetical protein